MSVQSLGKTPYRKLPHFYRTTIQLSTLLDVEQTLGQNDYRMVLELLGFPPEQVRFWGSRCMRPTLEALNEWDGSVQDLVEALQECDRVDCLSVLVQALLKTLQEGQGGKTTGTNILTQDTIPLSPFIVPPILTDEELKTATYNPEGLTQECKQTTNGWTDAIFGSSFSSVSIQDVTSHEDLVNDQFTRAQGCCTGRLSSQPDGLVTSMSSKPKHDLDLLLKSSFEVPTLNSTSSLDASSKGRKTTEFICNLVASAVKRCQCISNSDDLTWISNSTVYINNLARTYLFILFIVNIITCVFNSRHTPTYTLELIVTSIPVSQSLYVERNLPIYRELIRKVKETEASMGLILRSLEQRIGRSFSSENGVLHELDKRKATLRELRGEVMPLYSDIRLCIICTLVTEILLEFFILGVGLMCFSGQELLVRAGDGFTSLAMALLCIDCVYNFVLVAVYYHDRTIDTVIQRDRFHLNASLSSQKSVAV
ncbi:uncharacterized protein LOC117299985 [Asterias rubens]|uniref:uncharacterized protein LOC117299985 n=1 Tax=Asterias rubens TaxID=7604 RepID=UPI001455427C|nr:uncharacterized protein LOC117299985 [Asterias rubens]